MSKAARKLDMSPEAQAARSESAKKAAATRAANKAGQEQLRTVHKPLDSREAAGVAESTVQIPVEGDAALQKEDIQVIDGPGAMKKADEVAFMEEPILITIAESDSPNAENPVPVGVNGRSVYIFRGEPSVVRRKYVERLARAKTDSFKQDLTKTRPEDYNKLTKSVGLRYPFSVLEDKNPRGRDWLIKILRENG